MAEHTIRYETQTYACHLAGTETNTLKSTLKLTRPRLKRVAIDRPGDRLPNEIGVSLYLS